MIDNDRLADELNEYREDPDSEVTNSHIPSVSTAVSFWYGVIDLIVIFINSFAYGYSINLVAGTEWKFWSYMVLGLAVNQVISVISDILKR